MEIFGFLFEAIVGILDVFFAAADVYSWIKGKENRLARREAKDAGYPLPGRDRWNKNVIILTIVVGILSFVLLLALAARKS